MIFKDVFNLIQILCNSKKSSVNNEDEKDDEEEKKDEVEAMWQPHKKPIELIRLTICENLICK